MHRIISILISSAMSRILNVLLIFYLYKISPIILAEYAQSFAVMQISAVVFKFGCGPKVYRAAIRSSESGLNEIRRHNYVLFASLIPLVMLLLFNVSYAWEILACYCMAFISTRSIFLLARKIPYLGMTTEFLIPTSCMLFFIIIFNMTNFALVMLVATVPSFLILCIFTSEMSGQFRILNWERKDFFSTLNFIWIATTQQMNSNLAILIFAFFFDPAMVAYLRISQTLATPLMLINSSFATEFQRRYTLQNYFIDNKFKIYFILLVTTVTLLSFILIYYWPIMEVWFEIKVLAPQSLELFFIFVILNFIKMWFFFPDTEMIARKREDLIGITYFWVAILCLILATLFGYFANVFLTFIMLNSAPILIVVYCHLTRGKWLD